jgi:hypothetical protein
VIGPQHNTELSAFHPFALSLGGLQPCCEPIQPRPGNPIWVAILVEDMTCDCSFGRHLDNQIGNAFSRLYIYIESRRRGNSSGICGEMEVHCVGEKIVKALRNTDD